MCCVVSGLPYEAQISISEANTALDRLRSAIDEVERRNAAEIQQLRNEELTARTEERARMEKRKQDEIAFKSRRREALRLISPVVEQLPLLKANVVINKLQSDTDVQEALLLCKESVDVATRHAMEGDLDLTKVRVLNAFASRATLSHIVGVCGVRPPFVEQRTAFPNAVPSLSFSDNAVRLRVVEVHGSVPRWRHYLKRKTFYRRLCALSPCSLWLSLMCFRRRRAKANPPSMNTMTRPHG